jgi:chemotaxis protein MotB
VARNRRAVDHSEGEFLWLVSLSDLMILLFVFFVTLFSFSYNKMTPSDWEQMSQVLSGQKPEEVVTPLDETQKRLLKWAIDRKFLENVEIERKRDALILQIREKVLFPRGSADIDVEGVGVLQVIGEALKQVPAPYRIGIEGHTDDVASRAGNAMLNWELSSRRAISVLKVLNLSTEQLSRTVVMGYADQKPLAPNTDDSGQKIPANQERNRRVTIRIF